MSKKPGRKPQVSLYRKKELSSDAKIIVALLKRPLQTKTEICTSTKIKDRTSYRIISLLENLKIIKCEDSMYSLWNFDPLEKQVKNAFAKFRKNDFIGADRISNELGKPWPEIESVTCKVARNLGYTKGTINGRLVFYKTS